MPERAESFDYHDLPASEMKTPAKRKGCAGGCIGCLAIAIAVPVILLLIAYSVVFHSSMPLKLVAEALTEDNPSFQIEGLGGSISKGFTVDKIEFQVKSDGETESAIEISSIEDLTFKYGGLWKSIRNEELVIKELSAERIDIIVPPGFSSPKTDDFDLEEEETEDSSDPGLSENTSTNNPIKRFEIRKMRFANNRFRTADGKTDIKIPLFELKGLKIEGDDLDLEALTLESDTINLNLVDTKPDQVQGHTIPYKLKVVGKVLHEIHDLVISTIDFEVELASMGGVSKSRTKAFGGAFFQASLPGDTSIVQISDLTLSEYLDCIDQMVPERLNLSASQTKDDLNVEHGSFYLGKTPFKILSQQIDTKDEQSTLLAAATVSGQELNLRLKPNHDENWPPLIVTLESQGAASENDLVAEIYFARSYAELTSDEQARVDKLAGSATIKTAARQ